MGWSIPIFAEKSYPSSPKIWFWVLLFVVVQIIAVGIGIFILNYENPRKIVGFCVIPAILFYLLLYLFVGLKYVGSFYLARYWNNKIGTEVIPEWKAWGQKKKMIIGNVLISPEEEGFLSFFQNDTPWFPDQSRSLFFERSSIEELFYIVQENLEKQCSGWEKYLKHICLVLPENINDDTRNLYKAAVYSVWPDINMQFEHAQDYFSDIYQQEQQELTLVLGVQLWNDLDHELRYSEFVTAQLITDIEYAQQKKLPIIAQLGRLMPITVFSLTQDIQEFFEYGGVEKKTLNQIWLSNEAQNLTAEVTKLAIDNQLPQNTKSLQYVDNVFGKTGYLGYLVSLSLAIDKAKESQSSQFIINLPSFSQGILQYVTFSQIK